MKVTVTHEFASPEEAAAFLGGAKAAPGRRKKEETKVEDPEIDEFGEDSADDLDEFGEGEDKQTLLEQIQEVAGKLSTAGKKEVVTGLLKKLKEKAPTVKGLSTIPEKNQQAFLDALKKKV